MVLREKPELKERLIDAAEICFAEKGVAHTSMLDVASQAGVSRTSLYKHYPRIDDVLQAAFIREFDRFELKIGKVLARCAQPEARLLETVIGFAENVPQSSWIGLLVSGPRNKTEEKALRVGRQALDARVRAMLEQPLQDLVKTGRLRDDVEPGLVIEWLRVQVTAFSVLRHPGAHSKRVRRQLISVFLLQSILKM